MRWLRFEVVGWGNGGCKDSENIERGSLVDTPKKFKIASIWSKVLYTTRENLAKDTARGCHFS